MTPAEFIAKWNDATLRERQGSQMHFLDLCALLGEPQPTDPDAYCFERGATRAGSTDGWADVWRRGCFAWEYKGPHKDLDKAFRQLATYVSDLQNPPYLVTSDMARIVVRTNFTNTITRTIEFSLEDLREPPKLDLLRQVFQGSDRLKPVISPQELTARAVERFAELGQRLQNRRTPDDRPLHDPRAIAHFLNQLVFCMFAEDARLLPDGLFTRTLKGVQHRPERAKQALSDLFAAMAAENEDARYILGVGVIEWFNGGLFDGAEPLLLEPADLKLVADTAGEHDWSEIDPAIFGTMFEEALKATRKRAALGAHYTDRDKILKIVDPVILRPLTAEWEAARAEIAAAATAADAADAQRKVILDEVAAKLSAEDADAVSASEAARARQSKNLELFEEVGTRRLPPAAQAALKAIQPQLRKQDTVRQENLRAARDRLEAFLVRLSDYRVLDPACGSGNFLYVALHALRDLELRALIEAERLTGLQSPAPRVGLQCVRGIEIEPYAAELARVTLWIGDLQWSLKNGFRNWPRPILSTLDQIENRDALLNPDGTEAEWPVVDAIVGNPPFLGKARLRDGLGDAYVEQLFRTYRGRVPAEADFVTYWVEKAWRYVSPLPVGEGLSAREPKASGLARKGEGSISPQSPDRPLTLSADRIASLSEPQALSRREREPARRAGLVTTNSIRGGASRRVLDPIADAGAIWEAWADEPWTLQGAAVRVSMIGFGDGFVERQLEGRPVDQVQSDLTGTTLDLTKAVRLSENKAVAFLGIKKGGPFEVEGEVARSWLLMPTNPNGRRNTEVLRRRITGTDIVRRPLGQWIIDFGISLSETDAALFESPFRHVLTFVKPIRDRNRRDLRRLRWWLHSEVMPSLRRATERLPRYIGTPRVAKHRIFVWLDPTDLIDDGAGAIARDDDTTFGILHSRFHELWSLRMGTWLGVGNDPRYTPSTTFETFPFPEGLTPNIPADDYADDPRAVAIADAARELNALREAWLNPPDLVRIEPEVVPGYPDRVLPKDEAAAKVLKTRTLTNLYNQRPPWLDMAHRRLDAAVAAAYGWPDGNNGDLTDDEILERLFALNQERAAAGR